jgi:hypothetical protein
MPTFEQTLEQDVERQRKNARVQRVAWAVMSLTLVAALAGLFGSGPLSRVQAERGALRAEYERFVRRSAPNPLCFEIRSVSGPTLELWLDRRLLVRLEIESVAPAPRSQAFDGDGVTYAFDVERAAGSLGVVFHTRALSVGRLRGAVALAGEPALELEQFVYP